MRCVIMANGEYGDLTAYSEIFQEGDVILCADGGANYASKLGLMPACIIGDLDSIDHIVKEFYEASNVDLIRYPQRKDFTDIQASLNLAYEWDPEEIVMLGTLGGRVDHTLANLFLSIEPVMKGVKVSHFTPGCWVYIIKDQLQIKGNPGDMVSVLALTDLATGVSEVGFEYTPATPVLEKDKPYAVSNVLAGTTGRVDVQEGILAVFHYF